jgi:hypothetical protein
MVIKINKNSECQTMKVSNRKTLPKYGNKINNLIDTERIKKKNVTGISQPTTTTPAIEYQ